jgi:hypothetical protein
MADVYDGSVVRKENVAYVAADRIIYGRLSGSASEKSPIWNLKAGPRCSSYRCTGTSTVGIKRH